MAKEVEAFFIDMQEVFDESFRILKNGGRCCYVIGDTKLKGVSILNAEVFAESLQYSGLKLQEWTSQARQKIFSPQDYNYQVSEKTQEL